MLLLPSLFLAPVGVYALMLRAHEAGEEIREDVGEHFVKQTFRSRAEICGPNGRMTISLPVARGGKPLGQTPMHEVCLSPHGNPFHMLREALSTAYGMTPYYDYLSPELFSLLPDGDGASLVALNTSLRRFCCHALGFQPEVSQSRDFLNAPLVCAGKVWPEVDAVCPNYWQPQLSRHGFQRNLSVLDLIFCLGREGLPYLRHWADAFCPKIRAEKRNF